MRNKAILSFKQGTSFVLVTIEINLQMPNQPHKLMNILAVIKGIN